MYKKMIKSHFSTYSTNHYGINGQNIERFVSNWMTQANLYSRRNKTKIKFFVMNVVE